MNEAIPPEGSTVFKEAIWKMKTAPKIKHFLWRMLSNALAVGAILNHRGIITDPQCWRCCESEETVEHLFFQCFCAQAIWRGIDIPYPIIGDNVSSFEEKFTAIIECHNNVSLSPLRRQMSLWTLWRIWKSQNLLVYQRRSSVWHEDLGKALTEAKEWTECWHSESTAGMLRHLPINSLSKWSKPKEGFIKCNYDFSFVNQEVLGLSEMKKVFIKDLGKALEISIRSGDNQMVVFRSGPIKFVA